MSDLPDWEERCALALDELERTDLDDKTKLTRVKRALTGDLAAQEDQETLSYHDWQEVGVEPLPGSDEASPGEAVQYKCRKCGARGYRIVLPTSVTLYPIVSDSPICAR